MLCKKCKQDIPDHSKFCLYCGTSLFSKAKPKARRENKSGCVYKRKDVKSKPWVARSPAMLQDNGSLKRITIGSYETAKEAKAALFEYCKNPTTKFNMTLEEIHDEWEPRAYNKISKSMQDGYTASWKKLEPLYKTKFRELRTEDMQQIIDQYYTSGSSESTLKKIKTLLSLLYDHAMKNDIVDRKYSDFIEMPRFEKTEKQRFTTQEVEKIEKAAKKGVKYADTILMLCYTGYRVSEFLQMTAFNLHRQDGIMYLQGGIKTDAGKNRIVPIHNKIKPYYDAWLKKHGETIICRENGKAMSSDYYRNCCYYPALKEIGVRELSPHACRRTFSTRMSAAGAKQEDIIALMGHTNFDVDMEHYIIQEAETLNNAIQNLA